jgi:hypothetical protein
MSSQKLNLEKQLEIALQRISELEEALESFAAYEMSKPTPDSYVINARLGPGGKPQKITAADFRKAREFWSRGATNRVRS